MKLDFERHIKDLTKESEMKSEEIHRLNSGIKNELHKAMNSQIKNRKEENEENKKKYQELKQLELLGQKIINLNSESERIKQQSYNEIEALKKERDAMACKIELLEASIHEES